MATENDRSEEATGLSSSGALRVADLMLAIGFAFMLAWHYLVLFSPVFGDLSGDGAFQYLYDRQLVLYVSLAVTFGAVWLWGSARNRRGQRHVASMRLVLVVGAFAMASSGGYTLVCAFSADLWVRLLFVALMGAAEALLMFLWLRCFVNKRSEHFLRSFGANMVAGGLLSLLICYLLWPVAPIVAVLAPGISAIVLAVEAREARPEEQKVVLAAQAEQEKVEAGGSEKDPLELSDAEQERQKVVHRRNSLMTIFVAVYALAFGLMQGAYIAANVPLLMVNNAIVLLGIVVAGTVICLIPEKLNAALGIDMMHRVSLILFVLGAVIIGWFQLGDIPLVISQIAMLAGFNLFDFGVLVYGIEENRAKQQRGQHVIDKARPIVYLCLTAGLLLGHGIVAGSPIEDIPFVLVVICGMSVIVLVATTLMPFYEFDGGDREFPQVVIGDDAQCVTCSHAMLSTPAALPATVPAAKPEVPKEWESPWRHACNEIASLYQLSPRETEIFFLVAKGRNADYIQQELVISTHTAKTHIANIYRKLEVHSSQELLDLVEDMRHRA